MYSLKKFSKWFKLYLITLSIILAVILLGSMLYATLMNKPFFDVFRPTLMIGAIVLIGIGVVSMLPISEYAYTSPFGRGRAGVNPAIMREGAHHLRRGKEEPRERGIILGLVGLTLLVMYILVFP